MVHPVTYNVEQMKNESVSGGGAMASQAQIGGSTLVLRKKEPQLYDLLLWKQLCMGRVGELRCLMSCK